MDDQEKNKKNREGISNIILMIGIILIIGGGIFGFSNVLENSFEAFFICLTGTVLTFVANYLKHGYISFFNE